MSTPPSQLPAPIPNQQGRSFPWLALIALVVSLSLSAALAAFIWFQQQQFDAQIQTLVTGLNKSQQELSYLRSQSGDVLAQYRNSQEALEKASAALSDQVQFNAEQVSQLKNGNRLDWLLSETEYLLRLANQRLVLEHDIQGAELILTAADKVLKETNDPALTPVRIALAEELLALQQISEGDRTGAYAKLNALIQSIEQLPERTSRHQQANKLDNSDTDGAANNWYQKLLAGLKQAVRISKIDRSESPLMTPEQSYYLKQNLRLMLEQASLALFNQDEQVLKTSLTRAKAWISEYFQTDSPHVIASLENLSALERFQFVSSYPDISKSLRLLKTHIEGLYREHALSLNATPREKAEEIEAAE